MIQKGDILYGTYEIIDYISSGGGGVIYKAYHNRLHKYVAIKFIKENIKKYDLRSEIDILKSLKHEGIPQVYDFIEDAPIYATVMEFIEGGTLFEYIEQHGRLTYKQCLQYASELCSAVAYLHNHKPQILHLDIKPQNIMLTQEGRVCLIDFNISSILSNSNTPIGTSDGYSPPEQYLAKTTSKINIPEIQPVYAVDYKDKTYIDSGDTTYLNEDVTSIDDNTALLTSEYERNEDINLPRDDIVKLDARADVYSIGAVMYYMVTGIKPAKSDAKIKPLYEIDENIPEVYRYVVEKAMNYDKSARFASAVEMLTAFDNLPRLDRRYRHMRTRHMLAYLLCLTIISVSAVSAVYGRRLIEAENIDRLTLYIQQLADMSRVDDFTEFDEVFDQANDKYPESVDLHFYMAYKLYREGKYDESLNYAERNVIEKMELLPENIRADCYFMLADIYLRKCDYENSIIYYEYAADSDYDNPDMYRDWAVALTKAGRPDEAADVLETAINKGLTEDGIYMVDGEIQYALGEYQKSLELLETAIRITENNEILRSCCLLASDAYERLNSIPTEETLLDELELIEEVLARMPIEQTAQIRENLIKANITLGNLTGEHSYYYSALELLLQMSDMGWNNYQSDMNIAVLLDLTGQLEAAKEQILKMADNAEYEYYRYLIYIRLALCEAGLQDQVANEKRDYSLFDEYYKKAAAAYEDYVENGASDPEMERLSQLRAEMVRLGWLEK